MRPSATFASALLLCLVAVSARASSGDPQIKTDHPWYPGELSCSTFERLFKTQAEVYQRVTGRTVETDEDKALAAWYWRNLHYAHGEEGKCDLFGQGFNKTEWNRDYWAGLFAHGFGLCGTTHAQWNAEMDALLGHCKSRSAGVSGHNSFEVYLTGGAYGGGKWVLLDHDISTVIFDPTGSRLLSISEIKPQLKTLGDPKFKPERQHGWYVSGLEDNDARGVYTEFSTAEYLAGYAGPPPMVHLRSGETFRRYLKPGLEDGKTFVFWGMNYKEAGIPGPARSRTWVNQPERMYESKKGTGYKDGQVRYANAVFSYTPNFADGSYKECVVSEDDKQVTFEFRSPYVIGSTPANDSKWGIYDKGGKNGLVITSKAPLVGAIQVSVDGGKNWRGPALADESQTKWDLTDEVKGFNQYLLRIQAAPQSIAKSELTIRTVCQLNVATIPRLHDGTNQITFEASGVGIASAGPSLPQAEARVVDGKIGSRSVTLELTPPRGEKSVRVYAASWQASGNPPAPVKYQIEYSTDGGSTWNSVVKDWQITRRAPEPGDFWSQSFAWGDVELKDIAAPVRVRFKNDGGKSYRKVEAHLAYRISKPSPTQVTFGFNNAAGQSLTASHLYESGKQDATWSFDAGKNVQTQWVEFAVK